MAEQFVSEEAPIRKPPLVLLRPEEMRRRLSISRGQEYILLREDDAFPRPVRSRGGMRYYLESEVESYIARMVDRRDNGIDE